MTVTSILERIETAGAQTPTRPSLLLCGRQGVRPVSCGELSRAVEGWARILAPIGQAAPDGPPAIAVIVAGHNLDTYASFLGAMRAGMIACFLPPPTPKQDAALYWSSHRAVIARLSPAVILSAGNFQPHLRAGLGAELRLIAFEGPHPPGADILPSLATIAHDRRPALLQHSSGTTGLKKGVLLTHGQIRRQIEAYAASLDMTGDDAVASWLPLYHDMGLVTGLLMPLTLGSIVTAMDPFDWLARPDSLFEIIARFRISFCWLPNFAFAHLVNTASEDADYDLSSVRAFVDCSEPCRADTLDQFRARFARHGLRPGALTACYAMAETVFAVSQSTPGLPLRTLVIDQQALQLRSQAVILPAVRAGAMRIVSCGRPVTGTRVRIKPAAEVPCTGNSTPVGEIQVDSVSAFAGYFNDPDATEACLDGPWYGTGDLGFIDDGEIYITGRIKDLIIVNGRNFYAHDIEAVVSGVPGVKPGRAVAFAIPRAAAGSDGAVVLAESSVPPDHDEAALARRIGKAVFDVLGLTLHHVDIRPPGMLVKTTSGKLSRSENSRRYAEEIRA